MNQPIKRQPKVTARRNQFIDNPPTSSFGLPQRPGDGSPAPAPAPAPEPAAAPSLQHREGLPLPPGVPVTARGGQFVAASLLPPDTSSAVTLRQEQLTPHELAQLQALGWKSGQPIPGNLPQLLAEARQLQADATRTDNLPPPGDPATPPLQMPTAVGLDQLHPDSRFAIEQAMEQALAEKGRIGAPPMQAGGPGVAEAAQGRVHHEIQLVDDRTEAPVAPAETTAPGMSHCPHCMWDLQVPENIAVTREDKIAYLTANLGSLPFQKTYTLLGGHGQLVLRELSPSESDMCYVQLTYDAKHDRLKGQMDISEWLRRYRLCGQIVSLSFGSRRWVNQDSLHDWNLFDGEPTPLPGVWGELTEEMLRGENLVTTVMLTIGEFNRLASKLGVNITQPDFWTAIEPLA